MGIALSKISVDIYTTAVFILFHINIPSGRRRGWNCYHKCKHILSFETNTEETCTYKFCDKMVKVFPASFPLEKPLPPLSPIYMNEVVHVPVSQPAFCNVIFKEDSCFAHFSHRKGIPDLPDYKVSWHLQGPFQAVLSAVLAEQVPFCVSDGKLLHSDVAAAKGFPRFSISRTGFFFVMRYISSFRALFLWVLFPSLSLWKHYISFVIFLQQLFV